MKTQLRRIGNSVGSIIPAAMLRQLGLHEGQEMEVCITGNGLLLKPVHTSTPVLPFSEQELLADLDAHTAHSDALFELEPAETGSE